jgi:ubiquinone/menaquinone biosynthesis C-methylase UbiE
VRFFTICFFFLTGRDGTRRATQDRFPACADACALPFRRGSFDLVFMSHVLLLVPDIERCIAEISQCLAAGGKLVMHSTPAGRFEGQIDASGTLKGYYQGYYIYTLAWQRR